MDPLARRKLGRTDVEVTQLGFGGAGLGDLFDVVEDATPLPRCRRRGTPASATTTPSPVVWPRGRASTVSAARCIGGRGADYRAVHQGRPAVPRGARCGEFRAWLLARRAEVPAPVRLQLRRRDAQLRGQPATARPAAHRSAADPRPGHAVITAPTPKRDRLLTELHNGGCARVGGTAGGLGGSAGSARGSTKLGMIPRFLDLMDVDFFLVALPYTLLDTASAGQRISALRGEGGGLRHRRGVCVGHSGDRRGAGRALCLCADATPEMLAKVARIEAVCERHGVPLAAAALQFPFGHPVGGVGDSWRAGARARDAQCRGVPPSDPAGVVGGVEARGSAAGGRADAVSRLFRGLCHCFLLPGVQHGQHLLGVELQATLARS